MGHLTCRKIGEHLKYDKQLEEHTLFCPHTSHNVIQTAGHAVSHPDTLPSYLRISVTQLVMWRTLDSWSWTQLRLWKTSADCQNLKLL